MDGSDVLYDDLICRVDVALGMDIVDDIQKAARVMAQVLGHAVSQCRSIAWCKALTFDTP